MEAVEANATVEQEAEHEESEKEVMRVAVAVVEKEMATDRVVLYWLLVKQTSLSPPLPPPSLSCANERQSLCVNGGGQRETLRTGKPRSDHFARAELWLLSVQHSEFLSIIHIYLIIKTFVVT